MLRTLCIVGCVLAIVSDAPAGHAVDFRDAIRTALPATVAIRLESDQWAETVTEQRILRRGTPHDSARNPMDGWIARQLDATDHTLRSGFAVAADLIVTINIPPGTKDVEVLSDKRKTLPGQVVLRDHVTGLAVIRVAEGSFDSLSIGVESPEAGLAVVITWLRDGKHPTSDAAMIASRPSAFAASLGLTHELDTDVTAAVAGAPVLDPTGVVVGVIAQSRATDRIGGAVLCLSATALTRLIAAANDAEPKDLERGLVGIQFGENEEGDAVVRSVIDDSPAAEAGIEPGDSILGINGYETHSHWDVVAAVARARAGDEVTVVIERDGKTLQQTVELAAQPEKYVAERNAVEPAGREIFGLEGGRFVPLQQFNREWPLDDFQKLFGDKNLKLDNGVPFQHPRQLDRIQVERSRLEQAIQKLEANKKAQDEKIRELTEKIESMQSPAAQALRGEIREQVTELIEEMQKRLDQGDKE